MIYNVSHNIIFLARNVIFRFLGILYLHFLLETTNSFHIFVLNNFHPLF